MRISFLILLSFNLLTSTGLAQVTATWIAPSSFTRDQFCRETMMYFNIPLQTPVIVECNKTSQVRTVPHERKRPDILLNIEGTACFNKRGYVCQGVVRSNARVFLKNCIELVITKGLIPTECI